MAVCPWQRGGERRGGKVGGGGEHETRGKSNGCLFPLAVAPDQAEKRLFQPHMLIILALLALPSPNIHSPLSQYLGRKVQIAGRRERAVGGETARESDWLEGQVILHSNAGVTGARNLFSNLLLPLRPLASLLLVLTSRLPHHSFTTLSFSSLLSSSIPLFPLT